MTTLVSNRVERPLWDELAVERAAVEEELLLQVQSQVPSVAAVGHHTLRAGGKRLRPAFVGVGARATGLSFELERSRRVGVSMEMIHMATLIHDDVIDNASTRRGKPTAAAMFGNRASILSGDALLAKATMLLTQDGDVDLIRVVSSAVVDMAEGEVLEVEKRGVFDLSEGEHLTILRLKTASFIAACCEAGAIVAGAGETARSSLRIYGQNVGIAFQIVDDLLDYRGDRDRTGKSMATDFKEGQATLPLIYLGETASDREKETLRSRFGQCVDDDEIRMIAAWMEGRGAFGRCEALARSYVDSALEAVQSLPYSEARQFLANVGDYVLTRQF